MIARRKAWAAYDEVTAEGGTDFVILAADTEVIYENRLLGKPKDQSDAVRTLQMLSGQKHMVVTAVCFIDSQTKEELSQTETTWIKFRDLSNEEIINYVQSGDPMDKAGSYGIQGEARKFVESIEGDLDNVIGLPVSVVSSKVLPLLAKK